MTVTNLATGQSINLASTLNTKLEKPLLQAEMGLDAQATATGQAVRWNEFSLKHNNDGSFKGIVDGDVSGTAAIQSSKIASQKIYNKSTVANPSATANTNGTQVDLTPPSGFASIVPLGMNIVIGGTVGSETITAQVIATYSDSTTATLSKTFTATGTTALTTTDFITLFKDGVFINKLSVVSKTTIASTAATVTYNHIGYYL
jgi:hypothetical protein